MRQKTRKTLLLISFLLFPLSFFLFSPFLPFQAAAEAILAGATTIYICLFLLSFTLGRSFCGWLCPMSGLQDVCSSIKKKPTDPSKGWIKFLFWIPWILGLTVMFVVAKQPLFFNFFYEMPLKISIDEPWKFIIYYAVLGIIVGMAFIIGNRSFCRHACWIAPFMISGKKLGNLLHIPRLHLKTDQDSCVHCELCNRACPMNLDVHAMCQTGHILHDECILCGSCVDACSASCIHYSFSVPHKMKIEASSQKSEYSK
jgi:ferredoxin-type protein NapH